MDLYRKKIDEFVEEGRKNFRIDFHDWMNTIITKRPLKCIQMQAFADRYPIYNGVKVSYFQDEYRPVGYPAVKLNFSRCVLVGNKLRIL